MEGEVVNRTQSKTWAKFTENADIQSCTAVPYKEPAAPQRLTLNPLLSRRTMIIIYCRDTCLIL